MPKFELKLNGEVIETKNENPATFSIPTERTLKDIRYAIKYTDDDGCTGLTNYTVRACGWYNEDAVITNFDEEEYDEDEGQYVKTLFVSNGETLGLEIGSYHVECEDCVLATSSSEWFTVVKSNGKFLLNVESLPSGIANRNAKVYVKIGDNIEDILRVVQYVKKEWLTFIPDDSATFKFIGNDVQYTLDEGVTWNTLANDSSVDVEGGKTIMWKGNLTPVSETGIGHFSGNDVTFIVKNDPKSLLYGDNFEGVTSLVGKEFAFKHLFKGCKYLRDASQIQLSNVTTLSDSCYFGMFSGCTSLTGLPTTLEVSSTILAQRCYNDMFQWCHSITEVPEGYLPVTSIPEGADWCYSGMFQHCINLTKVPRLPATTLAHGCYNSFVKYCPNLEEVPSNWLPATSLANHCYQHMFEGCTKLTQTPTLPATTLNEGCYYAMFSGCTSLTTAPELLAKEIPSKAYEEMFNNCTNLNYIKCIATNLNWNSTTNWTRNVAESGTFVKDANMSSWSTGINGIPNGWTVQDA